MDGAGNGWRAGVLTKVADQLLDQLAVERKSNLELRDLETRTTEPPHEMSARRRLALSGAAALIAFVVPLAIARLAAPPPPAYVVPWVPLAPLAATPPAPVEPPLRTAALVPMGPPTPPPVEASTALTADQVREVVGRERAGVQRCYERAVRAGQLSIDGDGERLTVSADVLATGRVSSVRVRPVTTPLRDCITAVVRRWQFPASAGPSMPEIPFLFTTSTTFASSRAR